MDLTILEKIFKTWLDPVTRWKLQSRFVKLVGILNDKYKQNIVYPAKSLIFRALRETNYDNTRVVFLFQDPYHDGRATGIATANNTYPLSPSLEIIKEELEDDIGKVNFDHTLIKYCRQGVLFLNCALTVEDSKPESHLYIWRPWTEAFITSLSMEKPDLIWVLLGKKAQAWSKNIINGSIIKAPHPAAEIYAAKYGKKAGFFGSKIFTKINEELINLNKPPIKW